VDVDKLVVMSYAEAWEVHQVKLNSGLFSTPGHIIGQPAMDDYINKLVYIDGVVKYLDYQEKMGMYLMQGQHDDELVDVPWSSEVRRVVYVTKDPSTLVTLAEVVTLRDSVCKLVDTLRLVSAPNMTGAQTHELRSISNDLLKSFEA
jgi:hypothetical protein